LGDYDHFYWNQKPRRVGRGLVVTHGQRLSHTVVKTELADRESKGTKYGPNIVAIPGQTAWRATVLGWARMAW
jgi:hypothetical protein